MDWGKLFTALLQVEEGIVPIFVHNPQSKKVAAVIMATEASVPEIVASVTPAAAAAAGSQ